MLITKIDAIELNYLARGDGAEALEYLGKIAYNYFANQAVHADGNEILRNQGAAKFAEFLKTLPKGLRDGHDAKHLN